jgi:hypothetical protein
MTTGAATAMEKQPHTTIEAAPWLAVMYDQFDYLVAHVQRPCPKTCRDCRRLRRLQKILLTPFRKVTEIEGLYPKRKEERTV